MLLLDSCVFLWLAEERGRLSAPALAAAEDPALVRFVSAVSALELGIAQRRQRLILPLALEQWFPAVCNTYGIVPLPVSWQIAARSSQLPLIHNDPFDRLIIATAQVHGLRVVTPDQMIPRYSEADVLW